MPWKDPEKKREWRRAYYKTPRGMAARKRYRCTAKTNWRERLYGNVRPIPENCEACGRAFGDRLKANCDHDHADGLFRGWLCYGCNNTVGQMKDSVERLHGLINYLENAKLFK